jgi:hypothetical protein
VARLAPVLHSYPEALFVGVIPAAARDAIEQAIGELVAQSRARLGLSETRRRDNPLPDYLAVWDLREGWVGDGYDCAHEQTLTTIPDVLKDDVRTVQNRYRRAFYFLVGHEYTPELAEVVVGRYKWSRLTTGLPTRSVTSRRPRQTEQRRPVPETTLSGPGGGDAGRFVVDPTAGSDAEDGALRADIFELIAGGRTNRQTRAELELADDCFDVVLDHMCAGNGEAV